MRDLKKVTLPQQCRHHRVLRVCMNTTSRISLLERIAKQGCARRFFQVLFRTTQKDTICVGGRGGLWIRQNEHVRRFDPFFLNPGWGDVDLIPHMSDAREERLPRCYHPRMSFLHLHIHVVVMHIHFPGCSWCVLWRQHSAICPFLHPHVHVRIRSSTKLSQLT